MVTANGWDVVGASALGSRHVRSGQPNQDSSASGVVGSGSDATVVLAVGDGHGGRRYVRSECGSAIAVQVAVDEGRREVEAGLLDGPTRRIERAAREGLVPRIVERWRNECLAHLESNPFTGDETVRAGADLDVEPLVAYGSTLLVAILGRSQSLLLQLGDGDCIIGAADGSTHTPVPGDPRLHGGETTSLCLPDAADDFRLAVVGDLDPTIVVLATDGYGVAFADANWRSVVIQDLSASVSAHGSAYVGHRLDGWLEESALVGGDDVTVLVATRPAPVPSGPARSSTRGLPLALAALCGILFGGLLGWGLGYQAGMEQAAVLDENARIDTSQPGVMSGPDDTVLEESPDTTVANDGDDSDVVEGSGGSRPPVPDATGTTSAATEWPRE